MAGENPRADFCSGQVRVHYLTPVPQSQYGYAAEVEAAARQIFEDGPALRAANQLPRPDHNRASGAVLVEFGTTRALLMADAENRLWDDWIATSPPPELRRPVHFLKASHHGSNNGYHRPLHSAVTDPSVTVAVVTPFHHGRVRLPTLAGVQALRPHVRELYCTNRAAAATSTGLQWEPIAPPPLPRLPARWAGMIGRRPALGSLLVAETGVPASSEPVPSLPRQWVVDAQRIPALWRLISPAHRLPTATPNPVEAHTVSASFDRRGNLLELRLGEGAGRMIG
jgi:hypothetical protein